MPWFPRCCGREEREMIMVVQFASTSMSGIDFRVCDVLTGRVFVATRCPVKAGKVCRLLRAGEVVPSALLFG